MSSFLSLVFSFFSHAPLLRNSRFHGTFVRDIIEMNILERKKYVSFDNLCDKSLLLFLERKSIKKKYKKKGN